MVIPDVGNSENQLAAQLNGSRVAVCLKPWCCSCVKYWRYFDSEIMALSSAWNRRFSFILSFFFSLSVHRRFVSVLITADPRGGYVNNIRGFALVAMTEEERIVGSFSEQPDVLVASCDPLTEGDTAFHALASNNRRSLTLTWVPDSRNYGKVRFR